MRIFVFVEGESEKEALLSILRSFYPSFLVVSDPLDLSSSISSTTRNCIYIHNCCGVERIPFQINENYELITGQSVDEVLIFCDIEKNVRCAIGRKALIEGLLDQQVDKTKLNYVFSRLTIENTYSNFPQRVERAIRDIFRMRKGFAIGDSCDLPREVRRYGANINGVMRICGITYRKPEFSKYFFDGFSSLDQFEGHPSLMRLVTYFNSLMTTTD